MWYGRRNEIRIHRIKRDRIKEMIHPYTEQEQEQDKEETRIGCTYRIPEGEKRFVLLDSFLDENSCCDIVRYFLDNIGERSCSNAGNREFDHRILYYESIPEPSVRSRLSEIKYGAMRELRRFYRIDTIYCESCHIVRWAKGHSLGLHADNAYFPSGKPNYTNWRTFAAVLFLNRDFEGGEFYFHSYDSNGRDRSIRPKTGTLLAFGAGLDFVHGVREVEDGDRFTVAMWFTDDPSRIEL